MALVHLHKVVASPNLPTRVIREATRGTLIAGCAVNNGESVAAAAQALRQDLGFPTGARKAWQAFAERCSLEASGAQVPK
jgi:hypothetical protein